MKARWALIVVLVVVLIIPGTAFSWDKGGKSLCEFPYFGQWGNFEARFDQRLYDSDYFNGSYPNGGIKFELFFGIYNTAEERDRAVDSVFWVRFSNKSTGATYLVTKPTKYLYVDNFSGEFSLWHGHRAEAVGEWEMVLVTKQGRFTGFFTITDSMFEQDPPIAVDPEVIPDGDQLWVKAKPTNGDQYRIRIFDENDNFLTNDNMIQTIDENGEPVLYVSYPADEYLGKKIRIETRHYGTAWPAMIPGENCQVENLGPGSHARSVIWFKLVALD